MKRQAQNQERMASLRLHCSVSIATHQIAEWRTCANQLTPRVLHFSVSCRLLLMYTNCAHFVLFLSPTYTRQHCRWQQSCRKHPMYGHDVASNNVAPNRTIVYLEQHCCWPDHVFPETSLPATMLPSVLHTPYFIYTLPMILHIVW